MKRPLHRLATPLIAILLIHAAAAYSQEQQRGDASLRIEYQSIGTGTFKSDNAEFDYWSTDSQVAVLSGDYAISDRWTVFAALPYVRKRFKSEVPWGGDPHNPNDPYWIDFVPTDKRFWDDGKYHGALQDFSIGASYTVPVGPWNLSPFISYGVPASDYPFFAKAAIGKNLWTIPVGLAFNVAPYFSDWHFEGSVAYVFSEEPLGINVDHWLVDLSAGYWFRADFSVEAFLTLKYTREGVSLLWPEFINGNPEVPVYPDDWDTKEWYHHDRLVGNRIMNFGLGADYFFSRDWKLSGSAYQSIWTEESNEVDFAFTIAVTRFFGNE